MTREIVDVRVKLGNSTMITALASLLGASEMKTPKMCAERKTRMSQDYEAVNVWALRKDRSQTSP